MSTLGGSPTVGDGNGERGSVDWPEEAVKAGDVAEADISLAMQRDTRGIRRNLPLTTCVRNAFSTGAVLGT